MLDLRRLRLLRELSGRGTIGAVAEALSYSPSAVSQQLALLEREAGVPLLERAGRNVRLTAAAQTLVGHTEALLARVEAAEADLAATAEQITGTLRVATIQSPGLYLLAPALERLGAEHPALRVEVSDAEPEATMPALALGTLDMVLPRDHPLAAHGGPVALAALHAEPWAVGKAGTHYAELMLRACRGLGGFEPDVRHRSNDLLILLALVAARQAVTLLPELVGADRDPRVAVRDVAEAPLSRTVFSAIRPGSARRPALIALRAALRATVALRLSTG